MTKLPTWQLFQQCFLTRWNISSGVDSTGSVNGELIVGAYQGPVACQILAKNKGVCWAGIKQGKTIVVPDVHLFPDHIACDSRSKSEIVVPFKDKTGKITAVLDVDSSELNSFDEVDAEFLEKIVALI